MIGGRGLLSIAGSKGVWSSGSAYDPYMGRWSRLIASDFVSWLGVPAQRRWLDVGCGTGALSEAILKKGQPAQVTAVDLSQHYVEYARPLFNDARIKFKQGNALHLSSWEGGYDAVVSGLVLNFISEPRQALAEITRVTATNGMVAAYVWDYADQMQLLRYFWDSAITLNPEVRSLDEGQRSLICNPATLTSLFRDAGIGSVETRAIDVVARFANFDEYWLPFLGGQGTVASYAMSLREEERRELRACIMSRLPIAADGSIEMLLRAWAVKGICEDKKQSAA
jgi:SAM-dependent methyltransferase